MALDKLQVHRVYDRFVETLYFLVNSYSNAVRQAYVARYGRLLKTLSENLVKVNAVNPAVGSTCLNTYGRVSGLAVHMLFLVFIK